MEREYITCLLDSVDQKWGMGVSIDIYEGNYLVVNDAGDVYEFSVTDEQLRQLKDDPSIELALKFKL